MKKFEIDLPVTHEDLKQLKLKDIVFLNGLIITARDQAHKRIFESIKHNRDIPSLLKKLNGHAVYHCGPIIKEINGIYQFISGGPTTSQRMDKIENEIIRYLGIKFIIGKGGMKNLDTTNNKVVYLSYTGGCGAIIGDRIKNIENVLWSDLGLCEAIWFLDVNNFGPLIVTQANGESLYMWNK